jgi:deazaflavin-dependent oxidoreductase (nitroreductase family)
MTRDKKGIRIFNKYVTNRLLRVFAHASRGPFAIMRHVGRRSGKPYETTIMVWPIEGAFVIELTYGSSVDWYRNVQAAGGGTLLWHKQVYAVGKPEPMDAKTAALALPALARGFLRVMGLHEYVRLQIITP